MSKQRKHRGVPVKFFGKEPCYCICCASKKYNRKSDMKCEQLSKEREAELMADASAAAPEADKGGKL